MVKVDTVKLNGQEVEIEFHAKLDKFYAKFDDVEYEAKTLGELKDKLAKAAKKAKSFEPIPTTLLAARWGKPAKGSSWRHNEIDLQTGTEERGNAIDIVFRGVNPRTRSALITVESKKMSLESWKHGDTTIARRLTPAEHKQYKALTATLLAAEADLEQFITSVKFDVEAAVNGGNDGE